jgi:DNA-binding response OmpR family regulator
MVEDKKVYVLTVDDDAHVLNTLKLIIEEFDMIPLPADNVREALEILKQNKVDLILTDLMMPEIDGLELIDLVKESYPMVPIAVISAYGKPDNTVSALNRGAFSFVTKPFTIEGIRAIIEKGLRLRNLNLNTDFLKEFVSSQITIEFPSDESLFPTVNYFMLKECQWRGIEQDTLLTNIAISLDEMLMNGHIHGNRRETARKINLTAISQTEN